MTMRMLFLEGETIACLAQHTSPYHCETFVLDPPIWNLTLISPEDDSYVCV